jgi:Zn-dependent protease with chaperone function
VTLALLVSAAGFLLVLAGTFLLLGLAATLLVGGGALLVAGLFLMPVSRSTPPEAERRVHGIVP